MKASKQSMAAALALVTLLVPVASSAQMVDHQNLSTFDSLTPQQIQAAANLRMVFVNRSVGRNISLGLDCLAVSMESAPNYCRRADHPAPEFSVPDSVVSWSGSYDRSRWQFGGWPGTGILPEIECGASGSGYWNHLVECFIDFIDANPGVYDVVSFQFSYLEVTEHSDIADPERGFFASGDDRTRIGDLEALRQRHPHTTFVLQTTSLARAIGTAVSRDFNAQMRAYAQQHGWPLLDVAAILSHDVYGAPCYDNRDGVAYVVSGSVRENYPNDGVNYPAICQQYTSEVNGGHLGSPSAGKIRAAKGWWVLMAALADGTAPPPPEPPPPAPPAISPISCVVEGFQITCTATFQGDVSDATATIAVRSAAGQTATRSVTFPVR